MWWRVTGLALVMCGASPEHIGAAGWEEHPTLRALIKMVTSDRYRFPTVDCDDIARDEMKKTEQTMRDEVSAYCISPCTFVVDFANLICFYCHLKEARVTELLFLPKNPKKKKSELEGLDSIYAGSRVSKRQREKRERLLKRQREKEVADALAGKCIGSDPRCF
jgi:hypothetical protein